MKVLLVDDHSVVRHGFRRLLGEAFHDALISEASNSAEAVALVAKDSWDVVIVDLSMPGRGGLETLKEIHALRPTLPVLVATMHSETEYAIRAFRAGAAGFITKASPPDVVEKAIRAICAGRRFVLPQYTEALAEALHEGQGKSGQLLSDREFQVLSLLGKGRSVGQIAKDLVLSEKTVSTYRSRLLEKLALKTTGELMRYAIQNHLDC